MPTPTDEPCARDCRCTDFATVLAVDTTHVCVLARYAQETGHADVPGKFAMVLSHHICAGLRELMTSLALKTVEMNLADPDSPVRRYAPTLPVDALALVVPRDGGGGRKYKEAVPGISLDDRDCTLVAAASLGTDELVRLVTDDLDLFDVLSELLGSGQTGIWPIVPLDLLVKMYDCGALEFTDLEVIADLEADHHETYPLSLEKQRRKADNIRRALNQGAEIRVRRESAA